MSDPIIKPSQMTPGQRTAHWMETKQLPQIDGLAERLASHAAAREQARDPKWSREERDRRLAEIDSGLHPDVDAIVAEAKRALTRDLDQQEGTLRTDGGFDAEVDAGVAAKATLMAAQVAAATDPTSAMDVFEDAVFTENADLIRAVGTAVLGRLRDLAAKNTHVPTSPAKVALLSFEQRWQDWRRAHPSPRERLAAIARERFNRHVTIDEAARLILRLHGIGQPPAAPPTLRTMPEVVEETSRVREGPAFDTFFGRRPGQVRR
jgi:hypothetical protein